MTMAHVAAGRLASLETHWLCAPGNLLHVRTCQIVGAAEFDAFAFGLFVMTHAIPLSILLLT